MDAVLVGAWPPLSESRDPPLPCRMLGFCCCSCFSAMYWHTAGGTGIRVEVD
jgi:hypothetical protein